MAEGPGPGTGLLGRLRQQSAELEKVAVMGTYDYKEDPAMGLLTTQRLLEQIKQQKCDLENRFASGDVAIDEKALEYITKDYLRESAKQLHVGIKNMKVSHHNKSLAMQRAQKYGILNKKLLEKSKESEVLRKILKHNLTISSVLLKEERETRVLEKELIDIKKKRLKLKQECSVMMTELQTLADQQRSLKEPKEEKVKKVFEFIKKEIDITTLLQNIFQRLVFASNVNWAANPKLREAVLKAGKDLSGL